MQSTMRMKAVTLMHGEEPLELIVDLVIECDACGPHRLRIAGHHVRPVVEMLQQLLAREPELTEAGDCVEVWSKEARIYPENN